MSWGWGAVLRPLNNTASFCFVVCCTFLHELLWVFLCAFHPFMVANDLSKIQGEYEVFNETKARTLFESCL